MTLEAKQDRLPDPDTQNVPISPDSLGHGALHASEIRVHRTDTQSSEAAKEPKELEVVGVGSLVILWHQETETELEFFLVSGRHKATKTQITPEGTTTISDESALGLLLLGKKKNGQPFDLLRSGNTAIIRKIIDPATEPTVE